MGVAVPCMLHWAGSLKKRSGTSCSGALLYRPCTRLCHPFLHVAVPSPTDFPEVADVDLHPRMRSLCAPHPSYRWGQPQCGISLQEAWILHNARLDPISPRPVSIALPVPIPSRRPVTLPQGMTGRSAATSPPLVRIRTRLPYQPKSSCRAPD